MQASTGDYTFDYGQMGMKKINEIPSKNWLILKRLYLWNRWTEYGVVGVFLTWGVLGGHPKIIHPLHVSLNNFVYRPSFKNLRDDFLTKWPKMSKVSLEPLDRF